MSYMFISHHIIFNICSDVLTPVSGLQVSDILDTSAHLSWEHDDPCVAVDHYKILVTPTDSPNSKSMPPYSSDILSFTLTNLTSETSYKAEISVVIKDGNKSQAMIINFRTSGKFRQHHHHHHPPPPPPLLLLPPSSSSSSSSEHFHLKRDRSYKKKWEV